MTDKLNTKQVAQMFGVTTMTLANWRKGSPRRTALKTAKPPKGAHLESVWYGVKDLLTWAEKNGVPILIPAHNLDKPAATKPGPKPISIKQAPSKPKNKPSKRK